METIWCSEFERLQSLIAKSGGSLSIESARKFDEAAGQPIRFSSDWLMETTFLYI
jgi:hypothetical protein